MVTQLCFMRWRIEKCFDEIKNKIYETKAWAMTYDAKRMQAAFIITAYNLAQLLHVEIEVADENTTLRSSPVAGRSDPVTACLCAVLDPNF